MPADLITLVTYGGLPDLDPDDHFLRDALTRLGFQVKSAVWNDSEIDWSVAGACVIRSTWDYHLYYKEFRLWLEEAGRLSALFNPLPLLRWNADKRYLGELILAGLPVIETVFVDCNARVSLSDSLEEKKWTEFVVKPTVGLATSGVKKFSQKDNGGIESGEAHISELLKSGGALIQEFLPSVHEYGERALIFIDGEFSHAVRKSAFQILAVAGAAGETSVEVDDVEVEIAGRILEYLPERPLYARVDLVRNRSDEPVLLELELVEPSLFLKTCPSAAERLATALERRLRSL